MRIPVLLKKVNNKLVKLIPIFILVLGFFVVKNVLAASYWVTDPTDCPSNNQTYYPGQNCAELDICGTLSGNIAQCYDTDTINPPTAGTSSATVYSGALPGGYILDCFATDSAASGGYCSNNGDWWCNASSSCSAVNRLTDCTANQAGVATCGTCASGYEYCDGSYTDADGCEIELGVTATGTNAHYETSCTAVCDTNYHDCDNEGPALTDGCEIHDGTTCVSLSGLIGEYDGCGVAPDGFCRVDASYFETGVNVRYATSSPLLWGTQYGNGSLLELSASNTPGGIFTISNDGRVGIGTSTLGMNDMLTVGLDSGSQFIVSKTGVVTNGSWQAGVIGLAYGGTGLDLASSTGFLYLSNGTSTATSTIHIGNTDLAVANTGGSTLLSYSGNTISLATDGNWVGTVEGVDISTLASNDALDWDQLSDMSLATGNIYIGDTSGHPTATSSLFVASDGKVGIGTTTALSKLTVYGDALLEGANRYLNFNMATGFDGYGIRDNDGFIQYKNATGYWRNIANEGMSFSIFDYYNDQNKIFSMSNAVVLNGKIKITATSTYPCDRNFISDIDGIAYGEVLGADGECWLDRNLGASQVATSSTDTLAYGHYYQWGRSADGHQIATSGLTSVNADIPGHSNFITEDTSPYDWRVNQDNTLWQSATSTNNPCPSGYRLPTQSEWANLLTLAGITNDTTAYNSSLKLPLAGYRYRATGALSYQGVLGYYWSSSVNGANAYNLNFNSGDANPADYNSRAGGFSVRCVKD